LPLLANTVSAALWFARDRACTAGFVSARAAALARGACRAMLVNRLKIAGAALLAAVMLGTGATLLLRAAPQAGPPAPPAGQPAAQSRPDRAQTPDPPLPEGALARMGSRQLRHGDAVYFAAYTPDGKALVTAARDRTARLWDLATGTELRRFDRGRVRPEARAESSGDDTLGKLEQQALDAGAWGSQAALSADGSSEAQQVLGVLAGGAPSARLTREATSAVRRLSRQALGP
jgi:hypothetical protein